MSGAQNATIQRIQKSMTELEQTAYQKGLSPVEYVTTKPLKEPQNRDDYILSMAELGIESDVMSDDTLSWSVEIEAIEATLESYPEKETSTTLDQISDEERELLKRIVSQTPRTKSVDQGKTHDGFEFE